MILFRIPEHLQPSKACLFLPLSSFYSVVWIWWNSNYSLGCRVSSPPPPLFLILLPSPTCGGAGWQLCHKTRGVVLDGRWGWLHRWECEIRRVGYPTVGTVNKICCVCFCRDPEPLCVCVSASGGVRIQMEGGWRVWFSDSKRFQRSGLFRALGKSSVTVEWVCKHTDRILRVFEEGPINKFVLAWRVFKRSPLPALHSGHLIN